jgi:pullulanase-type alpha-1,6-glucosidase
MTFDPATGAWAALGTADWTGKYYLYQVDVYVPATGQVERNLVTDPYSFSLSTNSLRSQIVNLEDPALKPEGWDGVTKPLLAAPEDIVIYELHVRDFSARDESVPEELRGTYLAFTEAESAGMRHLRALAQAGLTHIHLLPVFDIASVDEDKAHWKRVDAAALAALPPDSDQQQLAVAAIREEDPFNWGYDPLHYTAPDGSYATDPDGAARIQEFRAMVQALNASGLRVVMDVVYNHTNASGQSPKSVLDKIVPGYYHRLNADGRVETSTCCQNTATEHAMMEKLMIDSLVTWATAYKVDGFRFDLMGHHMLANMANVRSALDGLTPEAHGVDGEQIYVYGEGWDFGEVAANARGKNATQLNIGGSGIGVFNDRLRDAARGGGPFGPKPEQGFLTGLLLDPNESDQGDEAAQRARLLRYSDWIRIGLAGNLADYELVNAAGRTVPGDRIDYNGNPAGYTLDPEENIVYISAHDNETLFDAIQWKAPASAGAAERVRMNNLGVSLVLLAQGVPFFHAGDDLLRSKSLDGNSYNSGDWFNRVDWTRQSNNWGVGLPNFATEQWDAMRALLGNPALKPGPGDIEAAHAHFREWLQIRRSSQLFRLRTAEEVRQRVAFYNTGPEQLPGLIVMALENSGEGRLPDAFDRVVALVNASPEAATFADPAFASADLVLHPILQESSDPVVREASFDAAAGGFTVPGRTAAVFVAVSDEPLPAATAAVTQAAQATATVAAPAFTPEPSPTERGETATATAQAPQARGGPSLGLWVGAGLLLAAALGAAVVWARRRGT